MLALEVSPPLAGKTVAERRPAIALCMLVVADVGRGGDVECNDTEFITPPGAPEVFAPFICCWTVAVKSVVLDLVMPLLLVLISPVLQ